MKVDAPKRTILKTLSWRIISLVVTFSITYAITHSSRFAVSISLLDNLFKMLIYYGHERYWTHIKWGRNKKKKKKKQEKLNSGESLRE